MDIGVVGWGGCGQSYLMEYLNHRGISTNSRDDADGKKHCLPHKWSDAFFTSRHRDPWSMPLLYVMGDPVTVIRSHYRRKWASEQAGKMTDRKELFQNHREVRKWASEQAGKMTDRKRTLPKTIEKYETLVVKEQRDFFEFIRHYDAWKKQGALPVTLDYIASNTSEIGRYIGKNVLNEIRIKKRACKREGNPDYLEFYSKIAQQTVGTV